MKNIFKLIFIALCLAGVMPASAQPNSAKQALLTLKTYKSGGEAVGMSYGYLIDHNGTVVSGWTPFNGADSAVVVDANGRSYPVEKIYGASELYDISKFCIGNAQSMQPIPTAKSLPTGSVKLWIMAKSPILVTPSRSEKFMDKYNYYVLGDESALKDNKVDYPNGCPAVNERGELVGIYNNGGTVLSVTDYRYANELKPTEFVYNDPVLKQTTIRKALPSDLKEAQLALMMSARSRTSDYMATAQDFIKMFPKENDGYSALASEYWQQGKTEEADKLLREAIDKVTDKAAAHYNYSKAIWQKVSLSPEPPFAAWTYDKAMQEADDAYKLNPIPAYDEMKGKIDYSRGKYKEAYDKFMSLAKSKLHTPDLFFEAAQCKMQLKASDTEILELLDSAVGVCDTPYTTLAAPYFYARGEQYNKMGRYRDAMLDLWRYEMLTPTGLSSAFYYEREQIELKAKVYQAALNDITRAVALDQKNAELWAEKANVHVRVAQYDDAIASADIAIQLSPEYATPYLIKGIAQCQTGKKAEGMQNLEKAKSLGETQADTFIAKFK